MRSVGLLLLLAACTARSATVDPLAGRVAGEPQNCITTTRNTTPTIVDGGAILYREGRRIWRTTAVDACPALRPETILIVESFGSQVCRNDIFRVLEPGRSIPSAPCRFDRFTPFEAPAR